MIIIIQIKLEPLNRKTNSVVEIKKDFQNEVFLNNERIGPIIKFNDDNDEVYDKLCEINAYEIEALSVNSSSFNEESEEDIKE